MKKAIIEVRDLVAKYGDKTILDGITVDFLEGEITIILGGSGCGKTTLLKNILRLFEPASGQVKMLDEIITDMPIEQYNEVLKKTGMLFQNGALLNSLNIYDNVAIPLEQHTNLPIEIMDRMIKTKLNLVNLGHAIYLLPSELSGGMKKRAALARAIALDPKILFCDEPSAGLDPISSEALDKLILNLKKQLKMSIIIVTHELASIHRIADKIVFLDGGKMIFNGTLEQAKQSNIEAVQVFFKTGEF